MESYPDEDVLSPPTSKRSSIRPSGTALSLNILQRDIKEAITRRCGSLRGKRSVPIVEPAPLRIPDASDVSILVTEPSPETTIPPVRPPLLRQQSEATVVHVLVHRESEEYQDGHDNS